MSKTLRLYHKLGKYYNLYWFKHELKYIRTELHRKFRHNNKISTKKGLDIESEPKTTGWETY